MKDLDLHLFQLTKCWCSVQFKDGQTRPEGQHPPSCLLTKRRKKLKKTNIFSIACPLGFYGDNCNLGCDYPYYGELCRFSCKDRCPENQCHKALGCPNQGKSVLRDCARNRDCAYNRDCAHNRDCATSAHMSSVVHIV